MEPRLLAVNTGIPQSAMYKGKEAKSGIFKQPSDVPVRLGLTGLEGDDQADQVNHGGPDKAVCVYSHEHYARWERVLERSLPLGAFGENFTVAGLTEESVHIGDVFAVGSVKLQVSQPRVPCWKLAMKWGLDELPALVTQSGASGFYFRVLEPGIVSAGDITLAERHPARVSVKEANRIMHFDKNDAEGIRRLLAVDALADSWRGTLERRLAKWEAEG
ncbi:MOSC domain-containing protein [Cohnella lubricantis]|uniref:MOSC domain-containing protein n=2 Tax=Cohnella lubricantis TaxID=2163172 RepID=A0A841T840_9BACL|nr:MOSC domain-containing protein [Cohnella lubricantis]